MKRCFIQSTLYHFQLCYLLSLGAFVPSFSEALEGEVYLYLNAIKTAFHFMKPCISN